MIMVSTVSFKEFHNEREPYGMVRILTPVFKSITSKHIMLPMK